MNSKYRQASHSDSGPSPGEHNPVLVQQALEDIFLSTPFRSTRQCQDLLRYVVHNTLAGLDQLLRERVIGAEVFGRKPDYDTGEDPVVRLRAAEVRKRLAQYYQSANGSARVRIDIPSGSYRATFEWTIPTGQQSLAVVSAPAVPPAFGDQEMSISPAGQVGARLPQPMLNLEQPRSVERRRPWSWALLAVFVLALGAGLLVRGLRDIQVTEFQQFWSPIVGSSKPVLICMGTNAVYRLSNEFLLTYLAEKHLDAHDGFDFFANLPPDKLIEARNLQKAYNSFVALGDVAAVSDVVAALTRQGKAFEQRFPPEISFAELQNTPTITVGGFNNPLTLTLTKDLRFFLAAGSRIEDRQDRTRSWSVGSNGDSHDTEDYAVISRLIDAKTGGPVISIAGIGQYGTRAAAEFISSPQAIANFVKTAPKGWAKKNMQVVLHIQIVNFRPIATSVVASQYW